MTGSTTSRLLLCVTLAACRPRGEPPVCAEYVEYNAQETTDTRILPFDVWYSILIPGVVRRPTLSVPDAPRECSGWPVAIRWGEGQDPDKDSRLSASRSPREELSEQDMTFSLGPDGQLLIWARFDYFEDGTAIGPVALVRMVQRGVEVRGIGTLWAPHRRARLRVEPFNGKDLLLLAEGEVCGSEGEACRRDTYLLPLVNQRFLQAGLVEGGVFVGPAHVAAHDQLDTPLATGSIQREEVDRSLSVEGAEVHLAESVTVLRCNSESNPITCQEYKKTRQSRTLRWERGNFVTTAGVWERMRTR